MSFNNPQRLETPVSPDVANVGTRWDRVRWGPIWAGAIVALPTFIVLQTFFFALGWLDLGFDGGGSAVATSVVSGILALIAFFVGGLVAGASALWRSTEDGVLHGVLVWALTVVGVIVFALFGGGAVLGPLASLLSNAIILEQQQLFGQDPNVNVGQLVQSARPAAGWSALFLGLAAGAAALGGVAGSKIWPRRSDRTVPTP